MISGSELKIPSRVISVLWWTYANPSTKDGLIPLAKMASDTRTSTIKRLTITAKVLVNRREASFRGNMIGISVIQKAKPQNACPGID